MNPQKKYRVVETTWAATGRVESDIGCGWQSEASAKAEMRDLAKQHPNKAYSLQKQK